MAFQHTSLHHYITILAVNRHDALGSSLQHHGARLMGNDKDLPAHHHYITTLLFLHSNGHDECFRGSHMHSLVFHRLQHTVRPCSTFRWKGIATSANRSPYMYSCVTQWAYLSQLFGSIGNNSQCTKLTEKTKKLVEVTDVTVLQNRHTHAPKQMPRGSIRMRTRTCIIIRAYIISLGWVTIVPVSRSRFSKIAHFYFPSLVALEL